MPKRDFTTEDESVKKRKSNTSRLLSELKKRPLKKEKREAFQNATIQDFDENYLQISDNTREVIKDVIISLIKDLNRLQISEDIPEKFDSVYLGGSFDSKTDLQNLSDVDICLMINTNDNIRKIQHEWAIRLENWVKETKLDGQFEFLRSHANCQLDKFHAKGIAINWIDHNLKVDILVYFHSSEWDEFEEFDGIKIVKSVQSNFQDKLDFYKQSLHEAGSNNMATTLQVYFTMANGFFIKSQPDVVKRIIRRYKYWQRICR